MNVYLLMRDDDDGGASSVMGVYATEAAAQAALERAPKRERLNLDVDEWPVLPA